MQELNQNGIYSHVIYPFFFILFHSLFLLSFLHSLLSSVLYVLNIFLIDVGVYISGWIQICRLFIIQISLRPIHRQHSESTRPASPSQKVSITCFHLPSEKFARCRYWIKEKEKKEETRKKETKKDNEERKQRK